MFNMFKKYHCPDCNNIMSRSKVKKQVKDSGLYRTLIYRCLICGSDKAKPLKYVFEEMVIDKYKKG